MKLSIITTALALVAGSSAWHLTIYTTRGEHIQSHGTRDSGCVNYDISHGTVNRAEFDPKTTAWPDPDTFELFAEVNCNRRNYRNGPGNHLFTPKTVRSYKVY
ncbi:MAG: hypothetical protein M1816_001298 [Peltula sp. TS41687]|nr:MAG: hypothetical protein M1816_001298 [Peltula sp. TS41687]